jgi:hypothetical protein
VLVVAQNTPRWAKCQNFEVVEPGAYCTSILVMQEIRATENIKGSQNVFNMLKNMNGHTLDPTKLLVSQLPLPIPALM